MNIMRFIIGFNQSTNYSPALNHLNTQRQGATLSEKSEQVI